MSLKEIKNGPPQAFRFVFKVEGSIFTRTAKNGQVMKKSEGEYLLIKH